MTPTPDTALAARLAKRLTALQSTKTDSDADPRQAAVQRALYVDALIDAHQFGQLITIADHNAAVQAAVAKAVEAALREHAGREETGEMITEKYLRRYPRSKKTRSWAGAMVNLRTQNGIWRPDGHGYTLHFSEAWVLPLNEARRTVSGIYEDHGGTYYRASAAAIRARKGDAL